MRVPVVLLAPPGSLLASPLSLTLLLRAWDGRDLCHTWRHRRQALHHGVGSGREGDVGLQTPSPWAGLGWQVQMKLEGLEPTQFGPCHRHCPVPCGHWCGWVWGKGCRALLASALSACSVTHLQMRRYEELSGVSVCWAEHLC